MGSTDLTLKTSNVINLLHLSSVEKVIKNEFF